MKDKLKRTKLELERIAKDELNLDFFPIVWEIVPEEVMLEVMSYGLPTRARHWSYGQSYDYQKAQGEMGLSKVYELVLNNDPSYAFLLESNTDVANIMVIAHVIGHVAFFKNNFLFKKTDRKMVYHAAERAQRVEEYITKYGLERVESVMNAALAIEKNIDWQRGIYRKPYDEVKKIWKNRKIGEFEDLLGITDSECIKVVKNKNFPPTKERDLLWFFANYGKMSPWKRDIFEIVREESFYFYPQYYTKIINEGFASYIHAELMSLLPKDFLSPSEFIEFGKIHERVVQPGGSKLNINPYFLGFTILNDIEKRWDEKYENGSSDINGKQKILEVIKEEDDISFLRNYLTQNIVDELEMFAYIEVFDKQKNKFIEIKSTTVIDIVEYMARGIYNYRSPIIEVTFANENELQLNHYSKEVGSLDPRHVERVLQYLAVIWPALISLDTVDNKGNKIIYYYDNEDGLRIKEGDSGRIVKISFHK